MKKLIILCSLTACLFLAACSSQAEEQKNQPKEITVAAAASLTDAVEEAAPLFEEATGTKVNTTFGSSGKLAKQIEHGAPVDLFLSADGMWVDELEEKELADTETRTNFAANRIVLITPKGQSKEDALTFKSLNKVPGEQTIAIGNPDSVPAGSYTKQALEKIQLWKDLKDQLVYASDVRQVLAYVESGEAAYGFVYASDAEISDNIQVVEQVDKNLHNPITYPGILISKSRTKDQAEAFLSFLKEDQGQDILRKYGFEVEG
ncbi:UNVERIFIED_CONTAM: molybdate ABC transporter substrate-binding protein [Halobacillus marinus]|uniref:molybdate ABC transporter substrate-binding protein n=1 Tax=Bacillus sp. SB49 TaxID=1071080 RepID=UPI000401E2B9|nr:molybdate ABC transporter substrate-binding protein [Bacillus sp. SB49]QHT45068.1 molybdate ABC transporter substrate-binding protein [Bacillus sp. SB49]